MSGRIFTIALIAVLVLTVAIRVAAALSSNSTAPNTDARDYDRHAVSIASGAGYPSALGTTGVSGPTAFRPPLYPFVLAGVYTLSGTGEERVRWLGGRLLQALIGSAIVALTALIALQIWGRREALVAAAIAAAYPPLVLAGTSLVTEPLFTALLLAGVAALVHHRLSDARLRWLLLAGVFAGLAALTRGNGLILVAAFALGAWTARPALSLRSLSGPAIVAATAALVVAPWTIRNAAELDAFVPVSTQPGFALAGQFNDLARGKQSRWVPPPAVPAYQPLFEDERLDEAEVSGRLTDHAIDYALSNPKSIAASVWWNTLRSLSLHDPIELERAEALSLGQPPTLAELSVYASWAVLLAALAGALTPAGRRVPLFISLIPPLVLATVVFASGNIRYRVPMDPILILFCAAAACWAWDRFASSGGDGRTGAAT